MSAPTIKLHYFPLRGRGEIPRLVLHAANRDFDDHRVPGADWPQLKPSAPFGSMPFLEVGDESFGQSLAIATYLARETGLYGSSNLDGIKIDQISQLREDLITEEVKVWKEKDAEKNAEMTKNMNDNSYPKFLGHLEKLVTQNQAKTGSKFAVGDKLSLADITIMEGTQTLRQKNAALLDKFPVVKALVEMVAAQDGIKQYLEKRPVSDL